MRVGSLFPAGSGESTSSPQAWHQVPFPAESSRWPECLLSIDRLTLKSKSQVCMYMWVQCDILVCADTVGGLTGAQQQGFCLEVVLCIKDT